MTTTSLILGSVLCLVSTLAVANGDSRPRVSGPVLGSEAFKPAQSGPAQGFKPPPDRVPGPPPAVTGRPLVDPEIDGMVGLVSFEQLRDIIERTPAPEDKRMLMRAYNKLLLLERDRRVYARSVQLLLEGCAPLKAKE